MKAFADVSSRPGLRPNEHPPVLSLISDPTLTMPSGRVPSARALVDLGLGPGKEDLAGENQ